MRWVVNTSCTVKALPASAASTSPREYSLVLSTFEAVPHTATGASGSSAAIGSVTGVSGL